MQIAVIGGGNMGLAFAEGVARAEAFSGATIYIVEPHEARRSEVEQLQLFNVCSSAAQLPPELDAVFLAVKPQVTVQVYPQVKSLLAENTVVISVMAGITVKEMVDALSHPVVVRAMPNLPARVGRGMTVACLARGVSEVQGELAQKILSSAGEVVVVSDEALLDGATAVSGSGPGFVFYLIEHFQKAASELGFTDSEAELLVRETFAGAVSLLASGDRSAEELRKQVTSKGGTTEAGLKSFEDARVGAGIVAGIKAACERSLELGKQK